MGSEVVEHVPLIIAEEFHGSVSKCREYRLEIGDLGTLGEFDPLSAFDPAFHVDTSPSSGTSSRSTMDDVSERVRSKHAESSGVVTAWAMSTGVCVPASSPVSFRAGENGHVKYDAGDEA